MDVLKKVIIALIISAGIYLGSQYWSEKNMMKSSVQNSKPIAIASEVEKSVFKKPLDRQIWLNTHPGESLYSGEVIKTGAKASMNIYFLKSDRLVQLEPDSMMVLQEESDAIKLDLLSGSIGVRQNKNFSSTSIEKKIEVQSNKNQLDLSQTTASLNRKSDTELNLQVHEGSVTLAENGKSQMISKGEEANFNQNQMLKVDNPIELLSPSYDSTLIKKNGQPAAISMKWRIKNNNWKKAQVSVQLGRSKENLKTMNAESEDTLEEKLYDGIYFWKVQVHQNDQLLAESSLSTFSLLSLPFPILSEPKDLSFFQNPEKQKINFKWEFPAEAEQGKFELFQDPSGQKILVSKEVQKESQFEQTLPAGKYYWRVSSYYPEYKKTLTSNLSSFEVSPLPPNPYPNLKVQWNSFPLNYEFILAAQANLSWKINQKNNLNWVLKVLPIKEKNDIRSPSSQEYATSTSFQPKSTQYILQLKAPGFYQIQVDGQDSTGRTIASTGPQVLSVVAKPLLENPRLLPLTGNLEGQESGEIKLKWESISGAEKYKIVIQGSDNQMKEYFSIEDQLQLKSLPPGTYEAQVYSVDSASRSSPVVEKRTFEIPDPQGLQSPQLKKIKVKK